MSAGRFAAALVLLLGATRPAGAHDLGKALLGTWEGTIQFRGLPRADPNRTLVIHSVTPTDHGPIAEGRYGISGKRMRNVTIDVDPSGTFLWIRFVSGAQQPIKLTLIDDRALAGTITLRGAGAKDRPMAFRKVSE